MLHYLHQTCCMHFEFVARCSHFGYGMTRSEFGWLKFGRVQAYNCLGLTLDNWMRWAFKVSRLLAESLLKTNSNRWASQLIKLQHVYDNKILLALLRGPRTDRKRMEGKTWKMQGLWGDLFTRDAVEGCRRGFGNVKQGVLSVLSTLQVRWGLIRWEVKRLRYIQAVQWRIEWWMSSRFHTLKRKSWEYIDLWAVTFLPSLALARLKGPEERMTSFGSIWISQNCTVCPRPLRSHFPLEIRPLSGTGLYWQVQSFFQLLNMSKCAEVLHYNNSQGSL